MILISISPEEFFGKMEQMLKEHQSGRIVETPQWLRSADVRDLLNIADSTLQTLRINGTVPAYKLGSIWFYKLEEINAIIEEGKIKGGKTC
ncbi:helix-turn-helix domain-containing protein [Draconibacterium sp. IB214405]|uniref:helix-turn-helix domain-containing protein n=1 Tax=Draconibacterium sp. IB214405 TaxID=3097352 RepID=UPI002A11986A|nr:helix-turn-helix domain-containing protein [Draconibacterium sp. IB214405]MDX8338765.1 helix-turn-helix domain-containing protein [Draconibacterium sp. IB214405]